MLRRPGQPQNPIYLIAHVTKTACLAAVAINRKILSPQRLPHKIRNHPSVFDLHPRPVGIEDAQNPRVHLVIAAIGHGCRFRKPLRLVVYRPRPDRVYVPPIRLGLRMHRRIAVAFRCRRHHELRTAPPGRFERFKRPVRSHPQGGDPMFGIVHRTRRTGEVKHIIQGAPLAGLANIFLHEFKSGVTLQMLDISEPSSQQIVRRDHGIAFAQQPIAEMRSQKAGPTSYQRASRIHQ